MVLEQLLHLFDHHLQALVMVIDMVGTEADNVTEWIFQSGMLQSLFNILPSHRDLLLFVLRESEVFPPAA